MNRYGIIGQVELLQSERIIDQNGFNDYALQQSLLNNSGAKLRKIASAYDNIKKGWAVGNPLILAALIPVVGNLVTGLLGGGKSNQVETCNCPPTDNPVNNPISLVGVAGAAFLITYLIKR